MYVDRKRVTPVFVSQQQQQQQQMHFDSLKRNSSSSSSSSSAAAFNYVSSLLRKVKGRLSAVQSFGSLKKQQQRQQQQYYKYQQPRIEFSNGNDYATLPRRSPQPPVTSSSEDNNGDDSQDAAISSTLFSVQLFGTLPRNMTSKKTKVKASNPVEKQQQQQSHQSSSPPSSSIGDNKKSKQKGFPDQLQIPVSSSLSKINSISTSIDSSSFCSSSTSLTFRRNYNQNGSSKNFSHQPTTNSSTLPSLKKNRQFFWEESDVSFILILFLYFFIIFFILHTFEKE